MLTALCAVAGIVLGYVIGLHVGEQENLGPEIQKLNRKLEQAWAALDDRDDWAERGIGTKGGGK